ncbi:GFA family protein [Sphingomonas solaris]|uniref:GFA family protein n=1 Tax=Alterirhizorhabdus solaris TaxID=2529389 RepID=UPI001EF0EEEB|nr:GFA family protein [Sphingomonas solaris]
MVDVTAVIGGGCHCGRVRYTARVTDSDAYACHCRMCQRTSGSIFIAFHNLLKSDVTWLCEPDHL